MAELLGSKHECEAVAVNGRVGQLSTSKDLLR